nr:hypothetical protein [Planctomycetota bacterium]
TNEARVPSRQIKRRLVYVGIVFFLILACAPWLIAHTPLRDPIINTLQNDPYLSITTDDASLGWITPTELKKVSVLSSDERVNISVKQLTVFSSLPQLWFKAPDVGTVQVERLAIHLKLPLKDNEDVVQEGGLFFKAHLKDTKILVEVDGEDEPIIDLRDLNLDAEVKRDASGEWLSLGQFTLYDHQPLTTELCDEFLQLIDPVLADVAAVAGSFSCKFEEFLVPLDSANNDEAIRDLKIKGVLTIHNLAGEFKTPLLRDLVSVLAETHEVKVPDVIRLAKDTTIIFEIREGRIFHEGLSFGFPDIAPDLIVRSQGSVGIDESLDLTIEVPQILGNDEKPAKGIKVKPLILRVQGTILKPIVTEVPEDDKSKKANPGENNDV